MLKDLFEIIHENPKGDAQVKEVASKGCSTEEPIEGRPDRVRVNYHFNDLAKVIMKSPKRDKILKKAFKIFFGKNSILDNLKAYESQPEIMEEFLASFVIHSSFIDRGDYDTTVTGRRMELLASKEAQEIVNQYKDSEIGYGLPANALSRGVFIRDQARLPEEQERLTFKYNTAVISLKEMQEATQSILDAEIDLGDNLDDIWGAGQRYVRHKLNEHLKNKEEQGEDYQIPETPSEEDLEVVRSFAKTVIAYSKKFKEMDRLDPDFENKFGKKYSFSANQFIHRLACNHAKYLKEITDAMNQHIDNPEAANKLISYMNRAVKGSPLANRDSAEVGKTAKAAYFIASDKIDELPTLVEKF